jgi:hypothetical protein
MADSALETNSVKELYDGEPGREGRIGGVRAYFSRENGMPLSLLK